MYRNSQIQILQGNNKFPAADAAVVIDVLRASSVQYTLFENNVKTIFLADSEAKAFEIKKALPEAVLVGEKNGYKIPGFDFGNSPEELLRSTLPHKAIHFTTNGTRALLNASKCAEVFSVGLNGMTDLVNLLIEKKLRKIAIIASHHKSDEDLAVAEHIKNMLCSEPVDLDKTINRIQKAECAEKFLDPKKLEFTEGDLTLCSTLRNANFVMKMVCQYDWPALKRINLNEKHT